MYATTLLAIAWGQTLAGVLMFICSLFLILLVLVQRGRGGGLSGAFGGMGGQSAFGTKAGDTFTRITIVAATLWIVLCMVAVRFLGNTDPNETILTEGSTQLIDELATDLAAGGLADEASGDLEADESGATVEAGDTELDSSSGAARALDESNSTEESPVLSSSNEED